MERTKPTQLRPYVSNLSSTITLEMADLCAKAVVVNHDVNIKTTKKSNSDNQKISSNQNNESFCCEICGKVNELFLHRLFCFQFMHDFVLKCVRNIV